MRKGREGRGRENIAMTGDGGTVENNGVDNGGNDPSRVKPSGSTGVICIKAVKEL